MGFTNPPWSWHELESTLSGRSRVGSNGRAPGSPAWNAGGDAPAWSRRRQPYTTTSVPTAGGPGVPYAELHCRSNFSFLEGASHPEALAAEAARLGLDALALTDRDGLYGVVRFAEAARAHDLPTVLGVEFTRVAPTAMVSTAWSDSPRPLVHMICQPCWEWSSPGSPRPGYIPVEWW